MNPTFRIAIILLIANAMLIITGAFLKMRGQESWGSALLIIGLLTGGLGVIALVAEALRQGRASR